MSDTFFVFKKYILKGLRDSFLVILLSTIILLFRDTKLDFNGYAYLSLIYILIFTIYRFIEFVNIDKVELINETMNIINELQKSYEDLVEIKGKILSMYDEFLIPNLDFSTQLAIYKDLKKLIKLEKKTIKKQKKLNKKYNYNIKLINVGI